MALERAFLSDCEFQPEVKMLVCVSQQLQLSGRSQPRSTARETTGVREAEEAEEAEEEEVEAEGQGCSSPGS